MGEAVETRNTGLDNDEANWYMKVHYSIFIYMLRIFQNENYKENSFLEVAVSRDLFEFPGERLAEGHVA